MSELAARFRSFVRTRPNLAVVVVVSLLSVVSGAMVAVPLVASHPGAPHATMAVENIGKPLLSGTQLQSSPFMTSPGTAFLGNSTTHLMGPVPTTDPVAFTIGFPPQNLPVLEQTLLEQQTPGSPMFHHWLTLEQENQMFAADPVAMQNTVNYFTSLGFQVGTRGPISISFTGPAGAANSAFKTQLVGTSSTDGSSGMAPAKPLSLPTPIAASISTVNGLETTVQAHPEHFISPAAAGDTVDTTPLAPTSLQNALTGKYVNTSQAFNFTNHAFLWFYFYSHHYRQYETYQVVTPGALDYLYNATSLLNAGYNGNSTGTPVTIALVMAGGINPGDIQDYGRLVFNNPRAIWDRLLPVPVDGAYTTNGTKTYTDGASGEMALDIDYSGTMALGARIMPVYGPCLCTNVLDDDYATIYNMPANQFPSIVSNSWGGDEDTWGNLYGPNWQNSLTMHYYFGLLDARGASVIASSGDGGGFDTRTGMLAGSFPATDPYVLSVAGTRLSATDSTNLAFPYTDSLGIANISVYSLYNWPLHVDTATQVQYQSYWYEPISNTTLYKAPPSGSGGFGTSYWFNQSWYEHGFGVPDVGRSLGTGVGAEADFNMTIYFDGGFEFLYGGTSFACPTTAGELALIDDYLAAHGHSRYLGDANIPVFWVANAYFNGNVSLVPFYDVVNNGTSYWGNYGVQKQFSWPPGQNFPHAAGGWSTYGNTSKGYDFPTGWGSINVYNFAVDLNQLESLPGTFMTLNTGATAFDVGAWAYMTLNKTYVVHMNASTTFAATSPVVTVEFFPTNGAEASIQPVLSAALVPSAGYNFNLDTSIAPFDSPGLIIFEAGNSASPTQGFAYGWISYPVPPGNLTVKVVEPSQNSIVGGYPQFNPWPFGYGAPTSVDPNCCTFYPNTFTVQVTFNGRPVYNALVQASIPDPSLLAWQGSRIQGATQSNGRPTAELTTTIVSQSFTNLSGYALVYTWDMIAPTTYSITAEYGTALASTSYNVTPGPNLGPTDNYGGKYSALNTVAFVLQQLRQPVTNTTESIWAPNSLNQTGYYNMIYAWQGELLGVHANDYQGNSLTGYNVWFGNLDLGGENKFYGYQQSGGVVGVTNTSGTTGITDANGDAQLYIPQNQSLHFFVYPNGTDAAGFGFVATSIPGVQNRTFSYTEPCAPTLPNPATTITCQFNDTFQRNYTATPVIVFQDPVKAWTQTTAKVQRDFFGEGALINAGVKVTLPPNDPFITGDGYNWNNSLEHIVDVKAYVDGVFAGNLTPDNPPSWQVYNSSVNLTTSLAPGIHELEVYVDDSLGHTFTAKHRFLVGGVTFDNLGITNQYTIVPYALNWTLDIPADQVNNHTFNQSLDIRFVGNTGCGGSGNPCQTVVNQSERIRNGFVHYGQLLNMTLLQLNHFYSGTAAFPEGVYQVILWLNVNHSGSIAAQVNTNLVFTTVHGAIAGPAANETVPLGNVTISYTYSGQFITAANLSVYAATNLVTPVFNVIAFLPGYGTRGGAATWQSVVGGPYEIVLSLSSPYQNVTVTENISVTETAGLVYLNQSTGPSPIGNMNPAVTATVLALVGGVIGLLLGIWVSPAFRRMPAGPKGAAPKPWEEGKGPSRPGVISCPICRDEFSTEFALHEHQKMAHGIEE